MRAIVVSSTARRMRMKPVGASTTFMKPSLSIGTRAPSCELTG
ncbi:MULTISPECIES: hypothetical protein [unclassified Caballeronia]|jgi:hypothetical protein|nr:MULTISPECIES: hypothetical protein [unclassified Caballeronia]